MSVDTVLDRLKEKGLRITPCSVHVIKLPYKLAHPTAGQIVVMVKHYTKGYV